MINMFKARAAALFCRGARRLQKPDLQSALVGSKEEERHRSGTGMGAYYSANGVYLDFAVQPGESFLHHALELVRLGLHH